MNIPRSSGPNCGHSLLELLVAVLLLALLLGMAMPSFRSLRANAALGAAANQMLLTLSQARSTALTRGMATTLCPTDAAYRCLPVAAASASGYVLHLGNAAGDVLQRKQLPPGLRLTATRPLLTYYPWPRAGTTISFTFCDTEAAAPARQVIVSQTGRARVLKSASATCP